MSHSTLRYVFAGVLALLGFLGMSLRPALVVADVLGLAASVWVAWSVHVRLQSARPPWPISPGKAALFHLLPGTNLLWLASWPLRVAPALGRTPAVGAACGVGLLFGLAIRLLGISSALGLAALVVHAVLDRPVENGVEPPSTRFMVLLETLWLAFPAAALATPPDVLSTVMLAALSLPPVLVASWMALDSVKGRPLAIQRAVGAGIAFFLPILLRSMVQGV